MGEKPLSTVIKYNGHQARIVQSLQYFQENHEMLDTKIICQGRVFSVIRALVSSLSIYFYKILKDQKGPTFTVVVNDVSFEIMQKVLTFMYQGDVKLQQNEISEFMLAATKFNLIATTSKAVQYIKAEHSANNQNIKIKTKAETKDYTYLPQSSDSVSNLKIEETRETIADEQQTKDKEAVTLKAKLEFTDEEVLIKDENNVEVRIKSDVEESEPEQKTVKKRQRYRKREPKNENPISSEYNGRYDLRNRRKNNIASTEQENEVDSDDYEKKPKSAKKLNSTCLICKQVFSTVYKMKQHIISAHSQVDDKEKQYSKPVSPVKSNFTCDICNKQCNSAKHLYDHRYRVHLLTSRGKRTNVKKYK